MPKAGTHFVAEILFALGGRRPISIEKPDWTKLEEANHHILTKGFQKRLFAGHLRCKGRARELLADNWKILVLIRDPRDVVLSMRDFLQHSDVTEHIRAYKMISNLS